jgi:predicted MFS family arabinose efflux permease
VTEVNAAARAVYAAFILAGVAAASWASRIPQVRDKLGLSPSQLGLVLLALAAGSIISLLLAGQIVARFGSSRTVAVMGGLLGLALFGISFGYEWGVLPVVLGLFGFGFANGAWDVAMNVQGAIVERRLGKAIMPRFHAGFSVGTVAGALLGALMVWLRVPVTAHLGIAGVLVALVVAWHARAFVSDLHDQDVPEPGDPTASISPLRAWIEPRTLLIGVFVLAFAFSEGTGNDWISVALIDGYGAPEAVGTLGFALFLASMTAGRWFGTPLLDRYGRAAVCRLLALLALAGLLLFVFGPALWVAFAGALLWGLGTSLGFPVGMSAGADEPRRAAGRVSVISSIGYCAFLGGPPVIGFLADHTSVLRALLAVVILIAVAIVIAGATRPPQSERPAS